MSAPPSTRSTPAGIPAGHVLTARSPSRGAYRTLECRHVSRSKQMIVTFTRETAEAWGIRHCDNCATIEREAVAEAGESEVLK